MFVALVFVLWYQQNSVDVVDDVNIASVRGFNDVLARREAALKVSATASRRASRLGNHYCIMQPVLSVRHRSGRPWTPEEAADHIALRAFMRTFVTTVTPSERKRFRFSIYYGHDSDDSVFGDDKLRSAFETRGREILDTAGFDRARTRLVFSPMYGLHGRINAIWNFLAKDAYYDGCDYFFMSNDDMVFFTKGWVSRSTDSLDGDGSDEQHARPCRYLGIVRFKDEWAPWATYTFHVSSRLHLDIFGGVYYPVPYYSAHNDYWIHNVYMGFDASKYRGEIRVRNRVEDVDYALAHEKDTKHVAPARYKYGKRGHVRELIRVGRARVSKWLAENEDTEFCLPTL